MTRILLGVIGSLLLSGSLVSPADAQRVRARVVVRTEDVLGSVVYQDGPRYDSYGRSYHGRQRYVDGCDHYDYDHETFKDCLEDEREYLKAVREAEREYAKAYREHLRESEKAYREYFRESEKDRREADREYWKAVREHNRDLAKHRRESWRP